MFRGGAAQGPKFGAKGLTCVHRFARGWMFRATRPTHTGPWSPQVLRASPSPFPNIVRAIPPIPQANPDASNVFDSFRSQNYGWPGNFRTLPRALTERLLHMFGTPHESLWHLKKRGTSGKERI
jgi:hypothetical protein